MSRIKDHSGLSVEEYVTTALLSVNLDDCSVSGWRRSVTTLSSAKMDVKDPATS